VASRVGGIPEVLGEDYRYLVPSRNPSAMAVAISSVLADREMGVHLGEQLRGRFLSNFSEAMMLDRVEQYFQRQLRAEQQHG
jgi:glycosyltransferase involved in cell wall biosynthesis